MAIVTCPVGHYYDNEKVSECPACKKREERKNEDIIPGRFPYVSGVEGPKDPVTIGGLFRPQSGTAYVTGWLVCIKGKMKGRDFRIHHGWNWLGKSMKMDIWFDGCDEIEKEKHCAIVYEDKSNQFFLVQGSGSVTYVNERLLTKPHTLTSGDMIQIGDSCFEFIPFCKGEKRWELEEK